MKKSYFYAPAMEFIGQKFNYVIVVCDNARQPCQVFPGKYEKIHWDLEDPDSFINKI